MPDTSASLISELPRLAGRAYRCHCGRAVFFRNSRCLSCNSVLGYDPHRARMLPLTPGATPDTWQALGEALVATGAEAGENSSASAPLSGQTYTRCLNLLTPAACNWLVPVEDRFGQGGLCNACRLNRTIPNLNDPLYPNNGLLWGRVERAKRRLVSALITLGLPVASRLAEDPRRGLMFDFLRSPDNGRHVMMGHNDGLITLNVNEADDATREAVREALDEPYRTLLGHLRHEVGHYYWYRLVAGTSWMSGFRQLFGNETLDYAASLRRNYREGPPVDWQLHHVSAYASAHPWEDWAECWAHYLHMRDSLDTALSFGLSTNRAQLEFTPFTLDTLYEPHHPEAGHFLAFINDWRHLTTLLNEMSRAMGQPDFYPFVLPHNVVAKLHFIHLLVSSGSWRPETAHEIATQA